MLPLVRAELTIEVARTPEDVFAYLTDVSNLPAWQSGVHSAQIEDGGEPRVGARIRESRHMLGRELNTTLEITEYDAPRVFSLRALDSPVPFIVRHELERARRRDAPHRHGRRRRGPAPGLRGRDHGAACGEAVPEGLRAVEATARGVSDAQAGRAASISRCTSSRTQHVARWSLTMPQACMPAHSVVGPTKRKPARLQPLRERLRLVRLRVPVGRRARHAVALGRIRPDELVQRRARLAQLEDAARVRDRRLDLAAVPHDARVAEQPLTSRSPKRATARGRSRRTRARKFSRLRRIVSHESPDWKPSRQSRS